MNMNEVFIFCSFPFLKINDCSCFIYERKIYVQMKGKLYGLPFLFTYLFLAINLYTGY